MTCNIAKGKLAVQHVYMLDPVHAASGLLVRVMTAQARQACQVYQGVSRM